MFETAKAHFHNGSGQSVVHLAGHFTRPSSVDGVNEGQIAGRSNGEGRGVACRVVSQKEI